MAALATIDQLYTLIGRPLPEPDSLAYKKAQFVLSLASDWARTFAKKVWDDPDAVPFTAHGLVLASARREIENPKRVTYEVKGPQSASYDKDNYPPGFFTDAEIAYLVKLSGSAGSSLWTLTTYRDPVEQSEDGYLRLDDGSWFNMYSGNDPGAEGAYHL